MTIGGQTFTVTQTGSGTGCTYSLSSASQAFEAAGGTQSIGVTAPVGRAWTMTNTSPWITVTPESGNGSGTMSFSVTPNTSPVSRAAILSIAGQSFTVSQAGAGGPGVTTIFYPRLRSSQTQTSAPDRMEFTGIAVANLDATNANLTFTAFDTSGSLISGTGVTNPATLTLKPGEQIPIVDFQLFGSGLSASDRTGWFRVESSGATKVVGFFLAFNETLTTLDGTDASSKTLASFVLPEIEDSGFTQIHVANPSTAPALITLELLKADGTPRVPAIHRNVAANGALAETFAQLFPDVTPDDSDYIRATSTQSVVPLEFLGKPLVYVEALNGQDLQGGATTLHSPQYAVGGGDWRTSVSIVNLDSSPGSVTFRLVGDNGVLIATPRVLPIAARGKIRITDQKFFLDPGNNLAQGYLEIESNGIRLAGSVVFGDPARNVYSSALPLISSYADTLVFG